MSTRWAPRWFMPVFSLCLGVAVLAAYWVGGNLDAGLKGFGVMAAVAIVFAVGGRSETIRGLRGDGRDEYWRSLDVGATTIAGVVVICALVVLSMWEWAHGRDGSPYAELCALGGGTYMVAFAVLRARR